MLTDLLSHVLTGVLTGALFAAAMAVPAFAGDLTTPGTAPAGLTRSLSGPELGQVAGPVPGNAHHMGIR